MLRTAKAVAVLALLGLVLGTQVGSARVPSVDTARLTDFEPFSEAEGVACAWDDARGQPLGGPLSAPLALRSAAQGQTEGRSGPPAASDSGVPACSAPGCTEIGSQKPVRFIQDPYPAFSGVNVDLARNEVILNDENRFNVMVYDRLTNTPPSAPKAEPKRTIGGRNTRLNFASGTYVDPKNGDIYAVNNDSLPGLMVFGREKQGNVKYDRFFPSPYGSYAIAADEENQVLFVTIQHDGAIAVWPKVFDEKVTALRIMQGTRTQLADPHGIAFDKQKHLLFVANYGTSRQAVAGTIGGFEPAPFPRILNFPAGNYPAYRHEVVLGTGKFSPPSISVYPSDGHGNVAPVRVIQGPKAQLNWPTGMAVDEERGEVFVSNAVGDSVAVFSSTAEGDVAPIRVLKGSKTQLANPTGLFVDPVNKELWVANFGSHSATVYSLTASGDAAPIRVIRSAPVEAKTTFISNPNSITYDSKRDQIIVPNCVGQPRIALFEKMADKDALPVRKVEGQKSLLNRTVHSVQFDPIHDEIVVNQNMGQAVLTFRGAASGEEAPVRVIQGPKTLMRDPEKVVLDAVHDEIFVLNMTVRRGGGTDKVLVFDRKSQGDVAPLRILTSEGATFSAGTVDPVHNLLILAGSIEGQGERLMIFDRTAGFDAKPKAVIGGPKSGMGATGKLEVYPATGMIAMLTGSRTDPYVGVWNIADNGDVLPRYTLGRGMFLETRGIALDTKDKNIIVSDKMLAGVLTFALPQFYTPEPPRATASLR